VNEGVPRGGPDQKREIALVINTPLGAQSKADSYYIRRASLVYNVPYFTTLAAARRLARDLALIRTTVGPESPEYHGSRAKLPGAQ